MIDQWGRGKGEESFSPSPAPGGRLLDGNPYSVSRPVPGVGERERKGRVQVASRRCKTNQRPTRGLISRAFPYPHRTCLCVVRSTAALFFPSEKNGHDFVVFVSFCFADDGCVLFFLLSVLLLLYHSLVDAHWLLNFVVSLHTYTRNRLTIKNGVDILRFALKKKRPKLNQSKNKQIYEKPRPSCTPKLAHLSHWAAANRYRVRSRVLYRSLAWQRPRLYIPYAGHTRAFEP